MHNTFQIVEKLGQHFLIDSRVAKYMVDALNPNKSDIVVEVGPGKGIITRMLAKKVKKVIAIEKDTSLRKYLKNLPDNVEVLWRDALKGIPPCDKIISNVPFYISSKLLFNLPPVPAVLGLQKEFAEKMVATPGSKGYGRLSASSQIKFSLKLLKNFPPEVFSPPPKVWLSIIHLKPKSFDDWKRSEEFIRHIFSYPNKKVDNALKLAGLPPQGINKRVRELTPAEIIKLAQNKY